jgi:carbon-monoxide dehydrogenase medium subunit
VIAGGTDLLLQLRSGECRADRIIDITGIEVLKQIREDDDWVFIGAAVTHAEVARNALIRKEGAALAEGCSHVGSPQIRNMATLMGNVINAQPAADGIIPLTALEAEIKVADEIGEHWIPMEETCFGVGQTCVYHGRELATAIRFQKMGERGRSGFFRLSRRKSLALPMLNGAVVLHIDAAAGRIEKARIALGPVAETPFRSKKAEEFLESKKISPDLAAAAARISSEEANPRKSLLRGGVDYRKDMVRVWVARTLQDLLKERLSNGG